jgi:hypothetical protein
MRVQLKHLIPPKTSRYQSVLSSPHRKQANPQQAGRRRRIRVRVNNTTETKPYEQSRQARVAHRQNEIDPKARADPRPAAVPAQCSGADDDSRAHGRSSSEASSAETGEEGRARRRRAGRRGRGRGTRASGAGGRGLLTERRCAQRLARFGKALREAPLRLAATWATAGIGPTCLRAESYGRFWVPRGLHE